VHPSLAHALAAFQLDLPRVVKAQTANIPTKGGPGYTYDYADLTSITDVAMPALAKHGLSVIFTTNYMDNRFILQCVMRHNSGEDTASFYPLPDPSNTAPQAMGSSMTYARRYLLTAITGIAPGGDDDGANAAVPAGPVQQASRPATPVRQAPPALASDYYDLGAVTTLQESRDLWKEAGKAGHMNLLVPLEGGLPPITFREWLENKASSFVPAPEAE
jgi:hypothetical protein